MGRGSPGTVVIVGGGVSGIAAAVRLAQLGTEVVLLEQKPLLGGRAYSYKDATTGDTVDNGQHVLIAGYERTLSFLDTIGTRNLLAVQSRPALLFHHPRRGFRWFRLPMLPSPIHLLWGVLTSTLLPAPDRFRMLRAGIAIRRAEGERLESLKGLTIERWLNSLGQTEECKQSFWEPLAVSIMNEHIDRASARLFVVTLREAFLSGWQSSALAIPRVGLSELYVDPARDFVTRRGGTIRCSADVVSLLYDARQVRGIRLRSGEELGASAVILAVPPRTAVALVSEDLWKPGSLAAIRDAVPSPIVSIHLWFEEDAMGDEVVGLIGRTVQWIFNRRKIEREPQRGAHISAVISAAADVLSCTNEELVAVAVRDIRSAYPRVAANPIHSVVIREKRATFPSKPDNEHLRPGQKTAVPNLFLAGDWTDTGYPATIEGAIVSAERCVQFVGDCISSRKY